jgi:hypothetical protein
MVEPPEVYITRRTIAEVVMTAGWIASGPDHAISNHFERDA